MCTLQTPGTNSIQTSLLHLPALILHTVRRSKNPRGLVVKRGDSSKMKYHFCTAVFTCTEALQLNRARAAPALQVEDPGGTQAPRLAEDERRGPGASR